MHRVAALRELEDTLSKDMPNITRFPRASSSRISQPATEQSLKDSGEEALALANALSRMIAENEARACDLVQRAVNDLVVAKLEIEELQARAARAEKRAEKAESYLLRVEDALEKLFKRRGGWLGSELNLRAP
jgi:hypothetical protein